MLGSVRIHTARELRVHTRHTIGRLDEPLARGVLADTLEQQANRLAHLILIDHVYPLPVFFHTQGIIPRQLTGTRSLRTVPTYQIELDTHSNGLKIDLLQ